MKSYFTLWVGPRSHTVNGRSKSAIGRKTIVLCLQHSFDKTLCALLLAWAWHCCCRSSFCPHHPHIVVPVPDVPVPSNAVPPAPPLLPGGIPVPPPPPGVDPALPPTTLFQSKLKLRPLFWNKVPVTLVRGRLVSSVQCTDGRICFKSDYVGLLFATSNFRIFCHWMAGCFDEMLALFFSPSFSVGKDTTQPCVCNCSSHPSILDWLTSSQRFVNGNSFADRIIDWLLNSLIFDWLIDWLIY